MVMNTAYVEKGYKNIKINNLWNNINPIKAGTTVSNPNDHLDIIFVHLAPDDSSIPPRLRRQLGKSETADMVSIEDLFDGIGVRGSAEIQAQIVFLSR